MSIITTSDEPDIDVQAASHPAGLTFTELNPLPLFVNWRNEARGDRTTKVPYTPGSARKAKSDAPATWAARAEAESWAPTIINHSGGKLGGGIGLMLGTLGSTNGLGRAGVDLDTCRDPESAVIEPWAMEVIERFASYTEVSPSGTGVKIFFAYAESDLATLLPAMGTSGGKAFKRAGHGTDHPPAIELYLNGRYFALTGEALPDQPADLRAVPLDTLLWLIRDAGPAFAGKPPQPFWQNLSGRLDEAENADSEDGDDAPTGRDNSRSAAAFRVAAQEKRRGASFDQMKEALLADPKTAEWTRSKGLVAGERELRRLWDKATARHGNGHGNRPVIRIIAGDLPAMVTKAEQALIAADLGIYQRSTFIMRPGYVRIAVSDDRSIDGQRILPVGDGALLEAFAKASAWESYNAKANDWFAADAPGLVVKAYRDRVGLWNLPVLAGLVNAPTLRSDGSLLATPGYDAQSGLLFDPCGATFPHIPDQPTQQDAREALAKLADLISTFPFIGGVDRAVALSAILTATIRRSIPTAPLHAYTAPTAGSGKSMLVDLCSIIATGREAAAVAQGQTEEETQKRLGAMLLAGETVIAIDNCDAPLGGDFLCSMLTQPKVKSRILGKSEMPDLPSNSFVTANGNNLSLRGDMTRRAVLCRLDPGCERPELRDFDRDPIKDAKEFRGHYLTAALTVLRAFHVAGRPEQARPLGSFGEWSRWVRDALLWLGEADPVASMEELRASDPVLESLNSVLAQWLTVIGHRPVSVRDIIEAATRQVTGDWGRQDFANPDFREALLTVAGAGGAVNSDRLGKWLGTHKDRIISIRSDIIIECVIKPCGISAGKKLWKLERTQGRSAQAA